MLVARKGPVKVHHFAHYSSQGCRYGYETSLHLAAKEILSKAKKMTVPGIVINSKTFYPAEKIDIERVELEHRFHNVIPDIIVYKHKEYFFVEIFVTHRVDDDKFKKLKALGISTIKIDLSNVSHSITREELSDILLEDSPLKYWIYNSDAEKLRERLAQIDRERQERERERQEQEWLKWQEQKRIREQERRQKLIEQQEQERIRQQEYKLQEQKRIEAFTKYLKESRRKHHIDTPIMDKSVAADIRKAPVHSNDFFQLSANNAMKAFINIE